MQPSKPSFIPISLVICLLLAGCAREYSVTLNDQPLYDPRNRLGRVQVADAALQGCINLALEQQEIEMAQNLTVLSCPGLDIRTLDGIEELTSLQFLDVSDNQLTRLDALRTAERLRAVTATGNPLTDITSLASLPALTSANLSGTGTIPCTQLDALARKLDFNLTRPASCEN